MSAPVSSILWLALSDLILITDLSLVFNNHSLFFLLLLLAQSFSSCWRLCGWEGHCTPVAVTAAAVCVCSKAERERESVGAAALCVCVEAAEAV